MKCIDCKWYAGQVNDTYGVCKRFPQTANKSQHDWCGEYESKIVVITPVQEKSTDYEWEQANKGVVGAYDISMDEIKPKRGRKPKQ
jgi:hypothetical protein